MKIIIKKKASGVFFVSLFNYFSGRLHSKQWVLGRREWGGSRGCLPLVRVIQRTSLLTSPLFLLAHFFTVHTLHLLFPSHTKHPHDGSLSPQAPAGSMHRPTYLNIRGTGWRIACKLWALSPLTPPSQKLSHPLIHELFNFHYEKEGEGFKLYTDIIGILLKD